jgi:hypothetical protein
MICRLLRPSRRSFALKRDLNRRKTARLVRPVMARDEAGAWNIANSAAQGTFDSFTQVGQAGLPCDG